MSAFSPIGQHQLDADNEGSFWPSFTDIMMVVVLIFLMASSLLIVRNWQLVNELQTSIEAEKLASEMIETTSLENATLEERLVNAEQLNSILRLRVLEKDELLRSSKNEDLRKQQVIENLEVDKAQLNRNIQDSKKELAEAKADISRMSTETEELANQVAIQNLKLKQQSEMLGATQMELELATAEIAALSATTEKQKLSINLLEQDKIEYNRQLLTLKGDYEVIVSKYEQLIKPARSAKGKYIAEVYYLKGKKGKVIRFKLPGDKNYKNLPLVDVEKRLAELKKEKGEDLYVKIIIPQNSGLTYNEAWTFMKTLLDKYDYYYQESNKTSTTQ